jgi:hypothetical protein
VYSGLERRRSGETRGNRRCDRVHIRGIDQDKSVAGTGGSHGRTFPTCSVAQDSSRRFGASQVDCLGKQDEHNGGRCSAGLFAYPRPFQQTSPSATLKIHPCCVVKMRMVPAMVFLFGHLSTT